MNPNPETAQAESVGYFPLPQEPRAVKNRAALPAVAMLTTAMASTFVFRDVRVITHDLPAAPEEPSQSILELSLPIMDEAGPRTLELVPYGGMKAVSDPPPQEKMVEAPKERAALFSVAPLTDIVKQGVQREDGFQEMGTAPPSEVQLSYATPPAAVKDPIVLDLRGDGIRASTRKVRFDLFGDGRYARIHDVGSGVGVLVFDPSRDGISGENGRELFGDATDLDGDGRPDGFKDGFEALWGLARLAAGRGQIPEAAVQSGVLGPAELASLERAWGLRVRMGSFNAKAVSLRAAGVAGLVLSGGETLRVEDFDGQGNVLARREGAGFLRPDGSMGGCGALWLQASRQQFRQYAWK